jgi:hypothetical protein
VRCSKHTRDAEAHPATPSVLTDQARKSAPQLCFTGFAGIIDSTVLERRNTFMQELQTEVIK